jgi:hypothetical protein
MIASDHLFSPPRPNPSLLAGRLAQRKDVIADYGQRKLGYAVLLVSFGLEYVLNQEQSREFVKMAREIGADEEKSAADELLGNTHRLERESGSVSRVADSQKRLRNRLCLCHVLLPADGAPGRDRVRRTGAPWG